MQGLHTTEEAQAIKEKLDQFYKNKTWTLVHQDEIEVGYRTLGGK